MNSKKNIIGILLVSFVQVLAASHSSVNIVTIFTPQSDTGDNFGGAVTDAFAQALDGNQIIVADFDAFKHLYALNEFSFMIQGSYKTEESKKAFEALKLTAQKNLTRLSSDWALYSDPNKHFFVFIPKNFTSKGPQELGFSANIKPITTEELFDLSDFAYTESATNKPFSRDTFSLLFDPKNFIRKRIFLLGHGIPGEIAGLSLKDYQWLLSYFNKLSADLLTVISCFIGGENLLAHYEQSIIKESGIPINYPIITLGLSTNVVSWKQKNIKQYLLAIDNFFSSDLKNRVVKSFADMLKPLNLDISATPSIKFPKTTFFRVIDVDKKVVPITYTTIGKIGLQMDLYKNMPAEEQKAAVQKVARVVGYEQSLNRALRYTQGQNVSHDIVVDSSKEALLLYPTIIGTPIIFKPQKTFPFVVSMIPGASRHVIKSIDASSFTLDQVLDSLSFKEFSAPLLLNPEALFIKNLTCNVIFNKLMRTVSLENVVIFRQKNFEQDTTIFVLFKVNNSYFTYDAKNKKPTIFSGPLTPIINYVLQESKPNDNILEAWSGDRESNEEFERLIETIFELAPLENVDMPDASPKPDNKGTFEYMDE